MPAAAISSSIEVATKPFSSTAVSASCSSRSRASPRFLGAPVNISTVPPVKSRSRAWQTRPAQRLREAHNSLISSGEISSSEPHHGSASRRPTVYISNPPIGGTRNGPPRTLNRSTPMTYRSRLPQIDGGLFLTDGGLETTLIYHE